MYKKLILVVLSGIALQTAKAQTAKGTQNLGLNVGFNSNKSTTQNLDAYTNTFYDVTYKQKNFQVSPTYSYFIADNLDLGGSVGYTHQKVNYVGQGYNMQEQTSQSIGGTIFLRKYFLYENKIGVRTGPSFGYSRAKQTNIISGTTDKETMNGYSGALQLDFVYYPVKNVGLSAGLGNISYTKSDNKESTNSYEGFNASFVNNLSLSVYYVFGK
jgi:hypothetical protein